MSMVRPAEVGDVAEVVDVVEVVAGAGLLVADGVDDVGALDEVVGAEGVAVPPEHAASVSAAAVATAPMLRRRIPLCSVRRSATVTDAAIVRKARSATMCGCPTG
jgi:hypothetical protein